MSTEVVDRQVEAYNAQDLESFVACYSAEVTIRDGHGRVLMSGLDAVRREYGEWFAAHPEVHVEVVGRLVSDAWVVDHERITVGDGVMSALVGYHVAEGVIEAVVLLSEES
jgi:hypothetical protein